MTTRPSTRSQLALAFSHRLVSMLKDQGHHSQASASGVKTKALAKELNCSLQIARRYTLGEALPESEQLLKMAAWLKVSPAWLLFGEGEARQGQVSTPAVEISPDLLRYVMQRMAPLFAATKDSDELVEFMIDVIYDAAQLKTNQKMRHKMIDVAIHSAERLHNKKFKKIINN